MSRGFLFMLLLLTLPIAAQARQYGARNAGKNYVVHTRVAPVLMHRALPPFKGQHVYSGRAEK